MGKKIRRIGSIKNKLFTSLAIFFAVSLGIVSIAFYLLFHNSIASIRNAELSRTSYYYSERLNRIFSEMESLCNVISNNYDIQQVIRSRRPEEKKEYLKERCQVDGNLALLIQAYTKEDYEVAVALEDGRLFHYAQHSMEKADEIYGSGWYQEAMGAEGIEWLYEKDSFVFNSLLSPYLIVQKPVRNIKTNEVCGIVYVELSQNILSKRLEEMAEEGDRISVWEENRLLFEEGYGKTETDWEKGTSTALKNGWTLKADVAEQLPLFSVMPVFLYCVFLVLILFTVFLIIRAYFKKYITLPITQLVEGMNELPLDDPEKPIELDTSLYEVKRLCESYNRMLKRLKNLIANVKQGQIENQKAQYAILQAQINPHFLYNTLDTIVWQIRMGKTDEALKNLMDFSRFFRLSLSKGRQLIPLKDELEHTRIYLKLMSVRYLGRIRFSITAISGEVETFQCPKLILQPIVENSINHGLIQKKSQSGIITVTVEKLGETIRMGVLDDGEGIPEEKLKTIQYDLSHPEENREEKSPQGYGIYNINRRLKLLYGEEYGVKIQSRYREGTQVTVTLPALQGGMEACSD